MWPLCMVGNLRSAARPFMDPRLAPNRSPHQRANACPNYGKNNSLVSNLRANRPLGSKVPTLPRGHRNHNLGIGGRRKIFFLDFSPSMALSPLILPSLLTHPHQAHSALTFSSLLQLSHQSSLTSIPSSSSAIKSRTLRLSCKLAKDKEKPSSQDAVLTRGHGRP